MVKRRLIRPILIGVSMIVLSNCAVTKSAQIAEGTARVKAAKANDITMIRSYRFICNSRPTTERRFLAKFNIKPREFDKFCGHLSGL